MHHILRMETDPERLAKVTLEFAAEKGFEFTAEEAAAGTRFRGQMELVRFMSFSQVGMF